MVQNPDSSSASSQVPSPQSFPSPEIFSRPCPPCCGMSLVCDSESLSSAQDAERRTKMSNNVDNVNMNPRNRKSLNYAMARAAIHEDANDIAKGNVARARTWVPAMKRHVINFLGGECVVENGKKFVTFSDGTKAKY